MENFMEIEGNREDIALETRLHPLLKAMENGEVIKKIVLMHGNMNKDKPELDLTIENVVAKTYWVHAGYNDKSGWVDYVDVAADGNRDGFYMQNVRFFEI
jgi:hypothetical protein